MEIVEAKGSGETITISEVAKLLGRSAGWVYQHMDKIPHRKIGNMFIISRQAF